MRKAVEEEGRKVLGMEKEEEFSERDRVEVPGE